ncbi:hypothetical protein J6590_013411 [Homalodisca vitripennis]|nr:hypothetical protein J6590_013411 [Homalodisca vitripennis]
MLELPPLHHTSKLSPPQMASRQHLHISKTALYFLRLCLVATIKCFVFAMNVLVLEDTYKSDKGAIEFFQEKFVPLSPMKGVCSNDMRINLTVAVPMLSLLFTFFYMGCLSSADAQVIFSRDWKAGKRSVGSDCLGNFPSAALICHMLIVTFSRDWKAGKRSVGPDCLGNFPSAASKCHMLIVTFSRDWKAGKRSVGPDCLGNFPSAASICHMLILLLILCEVPPVVYLNKKSARWEMRLAGYCAIWLHEKYMFEYRNRLSFPTSAAVNNVNTRRSELKALATCEAVTLLKHRGVDISPGQDTLESSRSDQR